jgi:pyrroline-5-carboxylate reductase
MYVILDALADGALKMGMNKTLAMRLATRTMHGAAAMVQAEKEKHIYQMKDEVCSPAGTTISGITELEKHRFRYALMKCVEKATLKAKEMSQHENERK